MPIWTDYRRTGFPIFIHFSADPFKKNATPPVRLLYPQTEINTNNDNVLLQGTIRFVYIKNFLAEPLITGICQKLKTFKKKEYEKQNIQD